jgi:hypothetical protein
MTTNNSTKPLGFLLVIQALLIFAPMYILGSSIDWPNSLDFPANQILPLIHSKAIEVRIGYFAYFIYSILFFFTATALANQLQITSTNSRLKLAKTTAGLSSLARLIGITRWLIPFPALATLYVQTTNTDVKIIQETVFTVVNATSTHHNMHHSKPGGHYGLYFTWWDKLTNTEFNDYHETFEKLTNKTT